MRRLVVSDALVLVRDPVFALTEGGAVGRSSAQRALSHGVSIAVCALKLFSSLKIDFFLVEFAKTHLFIRYFDSGRQLGINIVRILHLTSGDKRRVSLSLQPLDMLSPNLLAIVHTRFQIVVELRQLLLNVAQSVEWPVKFI